MSQTSLLLGLLVVPFLFSANGMNVGDSTIAFMSSKASTTDLQSTAIGEETHKSDPPILPGDNSSTTQTPTEVSCATDSSGCGASKPAEIFSPTSPPGGGVSQTQTPGEASSPPSPPGGDVSPTQTPGEASSPPSPPGGDVSPTKTPGEASSPPSPPGGDVSPTQTPGEASSSRSPPGGDVSPTQTPGEASSPPSPPGGDVSPTQTPSESSSPSSPPGGGVSQTQTPGDASSPPSPPGGDVSPTQTTGEASSPSSPPGGGVSPTQTSGEASSPPSPPEGDVSPTQTPGEASSPTSPTGGDVSATQTPGEASSPPSPPGGDVSPTQTPGDASSPPSSPGGDVSPTQTPGEASSPPSSPGGDVSPTKTPGEASSPPSPPGGDVSPTQTDSTGLSSGHIGTTQKPVEVSSPTSPPVNGSTQLPVEPSTTLTTTLTTITSLTTSSPLTAAGIQCENGDFDGLKCVCKNPNYYGSKCEFIASEITQNIVTAKVEVIIHVNETFSDELEDKKSKKYKEFEDRFLKQMKAFYKKEMDLEVDIVIIRLSKGSIRVNHDVIFKANFQNLTEEQEVFASRLNATFDKKCSSDPSETSEALCFDKAEVSVPRIELNELCSGLASEELREYFYGVNKTSELLCITNCSLENDHRLKCIHGHCDVSSKGPYCYCQTSDQYWYTGNLCETAISKVGVIAGVSVGLFIILLLFITLLYFSFGRQICTDKVKLENQEIHWYEEGCEFEAYEKHIFNPETGGPLNRSKFH